MSKSEAQIALEYVDFRLEQLAQQYLALTVALDPQTLRQMRLHAVALARARKYIEIDATARSLGEVYGITVDMGRPNDSRIS